MGPRNRPRRLVDVAREAGVSRWVAGRVLNGGSGNSRVSPATADRILRIARRLDYRPDLAARQLKGKRSGVVGVLVASAGDPLRSFLVQYLDEEAARLGWQTLIANTCVAPDRFEESVEEFARRRVDGVICAVHRWWPGDRMALVARHPRTVFYEDLSVPGAAVVAVDRARAARLAVGRLHERGCRRIALAIRGRRIPSQAERLRGYREELDARGLGFDPALVHEAPPGAKAFPVHRAEAGTWSFPVGEIVRAADRLVGEGGADGIVAPDDYWAALLLRELRRRGLGVPRDVAVVGYMNHYLADFTDPPLTTVDLDHAEAARRAVGMLHRLLEGDLRGDRRVELVEPRLVARESG